MNQNGHMSVARPHVARTLDWIPPLAVATGLAHRDGALCLLSDPRVPNSRSYVAVDPDLVTVTNTAPGQVFDALHDPRFAVGTIGLAAYDAGARAATGPREIVWPDLILARYPTILAFDHDAQTVTAHGWGESETLAKAACDRAETWVAQALMPTLPKPPTSAFTPKGPDSIYLDDVATVVARIKAGDLFQANIARGWTGTLDQSADTFDVFARLALVSDAAFGAFWRIGDRVLVSNSPELFVALDITTRRVETRPIKGTRPRHPDPIQDAAAAADLMASAKDRAENLMIVDLMRNDLARVCTPGSVSTSALFTLESLPSVHHLVSTVSGTLASGQTPADLLEASFPPGSITGAPKHQAMKVIADLEPPRGAWCGSLFVLDAEGNLTASVLIRTASFERRDGIWHFRALAGAGIVADSDPASELAETEVKISALKAAFVG